MSWVDAANSTDTRGGDRDVEIVDVTRLFGLRRGRQWAMASWTLLAAGLAGNAIVWSVIILNRPAASLAGHKTAIAIAFACGLACAAFFLYLGARTGRLGRRMTRVASLIAYVVAVLMILIVAFGALGAILRGSLVLQIVALFNALVFVPGAVVLVRGSRSVARLPKSLASIDSPAESALVPLIYPWRRMREFLFTDREGVPILALCCFVTNVIGASVLVIVVPVAGWIAAPFLAVGGILAGRRFMKSRIRELDAERLADSRPPILYLRSFLADHDRAWRLYPYSLAEALVLRLTFAETIGRLLGLSGPVLAIAGSGHDRFIGLAQENLTEEEWRDRATDLMDQAAAIVILAGRTAGVRWEASQLAARGHLHKTAILLPRTSDPEDLLAGRQLLDCIGVSADSVDLQTTVAVLPEVDGRPLAISVARKHRMRKYEFAVRAALGLLGLPGRVTESAVSRRRAPHASGRAVIATVLSLLVILGVPILVTDTAPAFSNSASGGSAYAAHPAPAAPTYAAQPAPAASTYPPQTALNFVAGCERQGGTPAGCTCIIRAIESQVPYDQWRVDAQQIALTGTLPPVYQVIQTSCLG